MKPTKGVDYRSFSMYQGSMHIITIGYYEASNGCILCKCWLAPLTRDLFYSDGLVNLGKKDKFVDIRLASKYEEDMLFSSIKDFGLEWNKETKCVKVDLSLIREDRFNIDVTDPFLDLNEGYVKMKPMEYRL